jgi:hypothetical protein
MYTRCEGANFVLSTNRIKFGKNVCAAALDRGIILQTAYTTRQIIADHKEGVDKRKRNNEEISMRGRL